jgi:hypothetical protein
MYKISHTENAGQHCLECAMSGGCCDIERKSARLTSSNVCVNADWRSTSHSGCASSVRLLALQNLPSCPLDALLLRSGRGGRLCLIGYEKLSYGDCEVGAAAQVSAAGRRSADCLIGLGMWGTSLGYVLRYSRRRGLAALKGSFL